MAKSVRKRKTKISAFLWLGIALGALILGALGYEAFKRANRVVTSQDDVVRVSAAAARREVENGNAILLDTRDAASFVAQHAKDAISFPLAEAETRLSELDPEKYYITYCT